MGFHSLVNTRYFSEAAIGWKKNGGRYTTAPHGSRDYYEYWEEQEKRCKYGYKVGDVWIPGRFYGYLNFFPISRVPDEVLSLAIKEGRDKRGRLSITTADKVMAFPKFWEIDYEWWNLKHIAWNGGSFMGVNSPGGKHMCCLKTRGAGFSYKEAWDGIYNYTFIDGSKSYFFAAAEPYLVGDAIMDKVQTGLDWINNYSPYWKKNRQKKFTLVHQKASYIDAYGTEKGSMSEIIAQIVDKPGKAHPYSANIITPEGPKKWVDIQKDSKIFGSDGSIINVLNTFELGEQDIYTMVLEDGRKVHCTLDHLWNITSWKEYQVNLKMYSTLIEETIDTAEIIKRLQYKSCKTDRLKIRFNGCTDYPEQKVPIDAYTVGIMLGDGTIKRTSKNISYLTMKYEDVDAIKQYIPYRVERETWGTGIRNKIYIDNGKQLFTDLNLIDKTSGTKFIPDIYKYNCKKVRLAIINGLLDTDGSITKDFGVIEYSTKSKQLAEDFIWVVHSLGYGGSIKERIIKGNIYYRCYLYCLSGNEELFNLPRKRERIKLKKSNAKATHIANYVHIKSVEFSHREKAKCIEVDARDSLYLIEDHIITHNTRGKRGRKATFEEGGSFPVLEKALEVCMGSMREGTGVYVGEITVFGTGGETGPSIQGLENVFNYPEAWDMLSFNNIWDGGLLGTECGYFVPCWRANSWAMDEDGNVDMIAAIQADDIERIKKKKTGKPKDLDGRKAEYPRTPAEALQRLNGNGFNIAEIDAQIKKLQTSRAHQQMLRYGRMITSDVTTSGYEFQVMPKLNAKPIESYPHTADDDLKGCVTILQRPYEDQKGNTPDGLYLATFDAYSKEESEDVTSLFSCKIWKQENLWDKSYIDIPVAWMASRPKSLEELYFQFFGLLAMYNAKAQGEIAGGGQGVFTYAKTNRLLHRLYNEPEMLHNKEVASKSAGNAYLMNMAADRKKLGLMYLEDWHMSPRGVDDKGHIIRNIHQVYDIAWLQELRKFNPEKGNFDRISDAIIAMFMLKERRAEMVKARRKAKAFYSDRVLFGGDYTEEGYTNAY